LNRWDAELKDTVQVQHVDITGAVSVACVILHTCDIICSQNSLQLLQRLHQFTLKVRIGQSHPHEECGTLDELGSVEQRLIRENGEESWTKKRQPELIPQRDVGIRVGMPEPKAQK